MSKKTLQENQNTLDKIISNTFEKINDLVDANTVVGKTLKLSDSLFIIPISKVSVGLISGGGNLGKKKKDTLSAGSSSGFSITPIGFVTINNSLIDFVSAGVTDNTTAKLIDTILNVYEKIVLKNGDENEENKD